FPHGGNLFRWVDYSAPLRRFANLSWPTYGWHMDRIPGLCRKLCRHPCPRYHRFHSGPHRKVLLGLRNNGLSRLGGCLVMVVIGRPAASGSLATVKFYKSRFG